MKKLKILVVPHAPAVQIRTRSGEIAKALSRMGHQVDVFKMELQPSRLSKIDKVFWHLFKLTEYQVKPIAENLSEIHLPRWQRSQGVFARLAQSLAVQILRQRKYDLVLSSSYGRFVAPQQRNTWYFYDVVDDHAWAAKNEGRQEEANEIQMYFEKQVQLADRILASSLTLKEKTSKETGKEVVYIPNGADLNKIKQAFARGKEASSSPSSSSEQDSVGPVIGYIGSLDHWVKTDLLIQACELLRSRFPQLRLRVVGGPVPEKKWPDWVEFTGFVDPEKIPQILQSFTVGTVPFLVNRFTDMALPLKVIEYGAAGKLVVSTALEELQWQKFPWVKIAETNPEDFSQKLEQALLEKWDQSWDQQVQKFSWDCAAKAIVEEFRKVAGSD